MLRMLRTGARGNGLKVLNEVSAFVVRERGGADEAAEDWTPVDGYGLGCKGATAGDQCTQL